MHSDSPDCLSSFPQSTQMNADVVTAGHSCFLPTTSKFTERDHRGMIRRQIFPAVLQRLQRACDPSPHPSTPLCYRSFDFSVISTYGSFWNIGWLCVGLKSSFRRTLCAADTKPPLCVCVLLTPRVSIIVWVQRAPLVPQIIHYLGSYDCITPDRNGKVT